MNMNKEAFHTSRTFSSFTFFSFLEEGPLFPLDFVLFGWLPVPKGGASAKGGWLAVVVSCSTSISSWVYSTVFLPVKNNYSRKYRCIHS